MGDRPIVETPDDRRRSVPLGDVDPAGSRQLGRRSGVCVCADAVVAGLADGSVVAFDADTLAPRWRHDGDGAGSAVTLAAVDGGVLVGERGPRGTIRLHDCTDGAVQWRRDAAVDVGDPQDDTRFAQPMVVDAAVHGGDLFVAARRYERDGADGRRFESVVYALDPDGGVRWRHAADASPVALDARGDRVAAAYNRCPGEHEDGLVVLDAATGGARRRWDPPGDGDRRVGDVALTRDGVAVASHADYRGYCLDDNGVRWAVDLGRPVDRDGETVYAYPNHVHATAAGAIFVTGNSYPEEGRETEARHPGEHAAVGVSPDGDRRWTGAVGGFAHEIATAGDAVAVPVAQQFRERDPSVHGVRLFDVGAGARRFYPADGVAAAAALAPDSAAVVEEPVAYHDRSVVDGAYRLHAVRR